MVHQDIIDMYRGMREIFQFLKIDTQVFPLIRRIRRLFGNLDNIYDVGGRTLYLLLTVSNVVATSTNYAYRTRTAGPLD